MTNEAKILAYFALPQKATFCLRSGLFQNQKQTFLPKLCDPFEWSLAVQTSQVTENLSLCSTCCP